MEGNSIDCLVRDNESLRVKFKETADGLVSYVEDFAEDGFVSANRLEMKDSMEISVSGNAERILLIARYDNLGKGASGSAVECMNIVLGADKTEGLEI